MQRLSLTHQSIIPARIILLLKPFVVTAVFRGLLASPMHEHRAVHGAQSARGRYGQHSLFGYGGYCINQCPTILRGIGLDVSLRLQGEKKVESLAIPGSHATVRAVHVRLEVRPGNSVASTMSCSSEGL